MCEFMGLCNITEEKQQLNVKFELSNTMEDKSKVQNKWLLRSSIRAHGLKHGQKI